MRKWAALPTAAVILLASCSGEDPGATDAHATAELVISQVQTDLPRVEGVGIGAVGTSEDCRLEIGEDEYGFEIEVTVCDGPVEPSDGGGTLEAWLGSPDALRLSRHLTDLLLLQTGCEAAGAFQGAEQIVRSAPAEIRDLLAGALDHMRAASFDCDDLTSWQAETEAALEDLEAVAEVIARSLDG